MRNLLIVITAVLLFSHHSAAFAQPNGLKTGDKAPEIVLASPGGRTVPLSALKGKVVLIDFWATWCAPCVQEQSELAVLYRKYKHAGFTKGKGFEIYGVSLDSKKSNWEEVIKKLNINWIQVSDLKFWRSPVAKIYRIQELPFNVLIDGNGIILAKNLHGIDLEKELARYLIRKGATK